MARCSQPPSSDLNKVLFDSADLTIGTFTAAPTHSSFENSGPIDRPIFVFPSTAVWIDDLCGARFVADPTLATFYNHGHQYRRRAIAPEGDVSVWIAPNRKLLDPAIARAGFSTTHRAPFSWRHRYVPPRVFCLQRALDRYLAGDISVDPTIVTRTTITLLRNLMPIAHHPREVTPKRHAETAEETKELLDTHFAERWTQREIAQSLGYSQYHLARLFRASVGLSIHAYRDQLRLRSALLKLPGVDNLATLALDLGYDSHSHFTSRFRRVFGLPPSVLRDTKDRELPALIGRLRHGCP